MLVMWQQKKSTNTQDSYQSPNSNSNPLNSVYNHSEASRNNNQLAIAHQLNMEKPHARSALKFVKTSSQSAVQWGSTARETASEKSPTKENTKPVDFKLRTQERALKRAMFNYSVATKLYLIERQKKQEERLQKMIEEEEIRLLRKEMIPRAQLMPIFDRPFFPQRSNRPLTVPKEPCFRMVSSKSCSCSSCADQLYSFEETDNEA